VDVLRRIKRLVISGQVRFTRKARDEMVLDALKENEVIEAIVNAVSIFKTLRSKSVARGKGGDRLYVIKGCTYQGTFVYTKGTIRKESGVEVYYVLISAKIATIAD